MRARAIELRGALGFALLTCAMIGAGCPAPASSRQTHPAPTASEPPAATTSPSTSPEPPPQPDAGPAEPIEGRYYDRLGPMESYVLHLHAAASGVALFSLEHSYESDSGSSGTTFSGHYVVAGQEITLAVNKLQTHWDDLPAHGGSEAKVRLFTPKPENITARITHSSPPRRLRIEVLAQRFGLSGGGFASRIELSRGLRAGSRCDTHAQCRADAPVCCAHAGHTCRSAADCNKRKCDGPEDCATGQHCVIAALGPVGCQAGPPCCATAECYDGCHQDSDCPSCRPDCQKGRCLKPGAPR